MAQIDRTEGLVGNTGYKAPCACATTANITLSGEQTIDGVTTSGSRVLVKDQTTTTENGVYVSDSGSWERADDFDGERDVATGTTIFVAAGTVNQGYWYVSTSGDPSPGDAMAFAQWNPISGRGAWVTATDYAVNDIVSDSGNSYICLTAHTSGTFATDLAAAKWLLLAAKGTDGADGADGAGTGDLISTNNLSDVTNAATARTNLGLAIGTNVQAYSAKLASLVANALTAANKIIMASAANTATEIDFLDEDAMTSNSATAVPSQQSVKAYVDAQAGGAWSLVETWTATASASKDFDLQEDVYGAWMFVVDGVIPASDDGQLLMRPGYSAGTVFDTANCSYLTFSSTGTDSTTPTTQWVVIGYRNSGTGDEVGIGTAAGEHGHATITIGGVGSTLAGGIVCASDFSFIDNAGGLLAGHLRSTYSNATERVWDAVRFLFDSGNFEAAGTIKMFGLKRAG